VRKRTSHDAASPKYAIKSLAPDVAQHGLPMTSDVWVEILRDVRRRASPNDDD
jgi:hypothetical protein